MRQKSKSYIANNLAILGICFADIALGMNFPKEEVARKSSSEFSNLHAEMTSRENEQLKNRITELEKYLQTLEKLCADTEKFDHDMLGELHDAHDMRESAEKRSEREVKLKRIAQARTLDLEKQNTELRASNELLRKTNLEKDKRIAELEAQLAKERAEKEKALRTSKGFETQAANSRRKVEKLESTDAQKQLDEHIAQSIEKDEKVKIALSKLENEKKLAESELEKEKERSTTQITLLHSQLEEARELFKTLQTLVHGLTEPKLCVAIADGGFEKNVHFNKLCPQDKMIIRKLADEFFQYSYIKSIFKISGEALTAFNFPVDQGVWGIPNKIEMDIDLIKKIGPHAWQKLETLRNTWLGNIFNPVTAILYGIKNETKREEVLEQFDAGYEAMRDLRNLLPEIWTNPTEGNIMYFLSIISNPYFYIKDEHSIEMYMNKFQKQSQLIAQFTKHALGSRTLTLRPTPLAHQQTMQMPNSSSADGTSRVAIISLVSEDIRYDMIPMPSTSGSGIQSFEIVKQTKESIEEKGAEIVRHPIDPKFRSTSNSITSSNTDVSTQESIDDDDDDYLQGTTTQQYKKQQQKSKRQQKQQQKQKSQKRK